jgi:phosphoribosylformimino-5-aminoimidazole carboxamide ribotide isomerase
VQVVPVMDLMRGEVVRGVGGRRHEYRPITSVLSADARPATVAAALARAGFRQAYLADLDAIGGAPPAWTTYAEILRSGLDLWVDAGLSTVEQAGEMAAFAAERRPLSAIVAGLESLADPQSLADMVKLVGPGRLVFSLDLKAGEPLVGSAAWRGLDARQIANLALRAGVRRMILLDLAQVGMGQGVSTAPLCRALGSLGAQVQILAGGGVRSLADLRVLAAAGCDAALVASALHDGRLSPGDCESLHGSPLPRALGA